MTEFLQTLATSILIASITAAITVRLSLAQFRSQRWWERKAEGYSDVVGKLSDVKVSLDEWLSREFGEKSLSESSEQKLADSYESAVGVLRKTAAAGAFILSDTAAKELARVIIEIDRSTSPNWVKDLENAQYEVGRAIDFLRAEASRDLHGRGFLRFGR